MVLNMTTINVNSERRTIEMSKAFAKLAHQYGTSEYNDLQAVRKDYPTFKEVIIKTSRKNDKFKGITKDYIEKYIKLHDDENLSNMKNYKILIGDVDTNETDMQIPSKASFFEIKKWFLETYPEIEEFANASQERINKILNHVA